MARLIYSKSALADLERIIDFCAEADPALAERVLSLIQEAVQTLERHPLIGRSVEAGLQELIISHGDTGVVALYDFVVAEGVVPILAIRHQREAGFP